MNRFLHDPKATEGFVGCALFANVFRFFKTADGSWDAEKVIDIPNKKVWILEGQGEKVLAPPPHEKNTLDCLKIIKQLNPVWFIGFFFGASRGAPLILKKTVNVPFLPKINGYLKFFF